MIDDYLVLNCKLIIEDLNQKFERHEKNEILQYATTEFDESDLVFLLAYPFRNMSKVSMQGKNEDIIIKRLDFIIEVKYLYATKAASGQFSNKRDMEDSFEKDFNWLKNEISNNDKKGYRAFILGWYNVYGTFTNVMQLGQARGPNPLVKREKLDYFPFLHIPSNREAKISDVEYRYKNNEINSTFTSKTFSSYTVHQPDFKETINCIFMGDQNDVFHFAIYY